MLIADKIALCITIISIIGWLMCFYFAEKWFSKFVRFGLFGLLIVIFYLIDFSECAVDGLSKYFQTGKKLDLLGIVYIFGPYLIISVFTATHFLKKPKSQSTKNVD